MTNKHKPAAGAEGATRAVEGLSEMMTNAAARGYEAAESGLAAWSDEAQRFYDELTAQGLSVIDQLRNCKTPLDVLSTEQAWVTARAKAYLESGLRFGQVFAKIAQGAHAGAAKVAAE